MIAAAEIGQGSETVLLQVATEAIGHADYFVSSEETEPLDGWAYDQFLKLLVTKPNATAEELAKKIVATYTDATLSAVTMSEMSSLNSTLDSFADEAISKATSSDWNHIKTARNSATEFKS